MTAYPGPVPIPARITQALDHAGLFGPEVDAALGVEEPTVDRWEAGEELPTPAQVERLAALTGRPVEWFSHPVADWEATRTRFFLCDRSRRGENGLVIAEAWIDWDGVQHVEELTPPRPPKRVKKPLLTSGGTSRDPGDVVINEADSSPAYLRSPGRHDYDPDPEVPGVCRCGVIERHGRHRKAVARPAPPAPKTGPRIDWGRLAAADRDDD